MAAGPSPLFGVLFHGAGAFLSANCYAPQKYLRRWSWEIFWMVQASWCWLIWPIVGAAITIPHLWCVLATAPKACMVYSFLLGLAYGVGGTAFNVSIRYIGFSLTYAIAVGLSSVLGTLVPPLVRGQFGEILSKTGSEWLMIGVAAGAMGIAVCGLAGRLKEMDLRNQQDNSQFCLAKGLILSLVAGVLSAVYGFALEVAQPVVDMAESYGAGEWRGNVAYLFANPGAFITALAYSLYLARKNRSLGELAGIEGQSLKTLARNYLLALLTGTLWYGQFFFYNLGHVRLGKEYAFSSWAIHMILLVLFSNLSGMLFGEWRKCRATTRVAAALGLLVLCGAVLLLTYGNYLGSLSSAAGE